MESKVCFCGQTVWYADRYCVGCGRPVSWKPPVPTKEAEKILASSKVKEGKKK